MSAASPGAPVEMGGSLVGRRTLLLLVTALSVVGVVGMRLLHHTGAGRRFDIAAGRDAATALSDSHVEHAMSIVLDTVSVGSLLLVGGAFVVIALIWRRVDLAIAGAVLLGGSLATTELLKLRLHSPPEVPDRLRASYPSGHATVALALGLTVVLLAPPTLRTLAVAVAIAYAAIVGGALVFTAWHYPSDVGGGFFVATAWAAVAAQLVHSPAERPLPLRPLAALAAAVAVAALAAELGTPAAQAHDDLRAAVVAAVAGVVALAAVCAATFAYAFSRPAGRR